MIAFLVRAWIDGVILTFGLVSAIGTVILVCLCSYHIGVGLWERFSRR